MSKSKPKPKRKQLDWEKIEKQYRAGMLSVREIAREHGIFHQAIQKKAKSNKWERDLDEQVKKVARRKLVANQVATPHASDEEIIEEASNQVVEVVKLHRSGVRRGREIVELLSEQLSEMAKGRAEIENTIIDETANDPKSSRRRAQMMRAVSLPGHAGVLRDLAIAIKSLIPLERQAYNLDNNSKPLTSLEDLLGEINGATRGLPVKTEIAGDPK